MHDDKVVCVKFDPPRAESAPCRTPGPGSYEVSGREAVPTYSWGNGQRYDPSAQTMYVPGPGAYDIDRSLNRTGGKVVSFTPRLSPTRTDPSVPGPGSYNLPSPFSSQSVMLRGKPSDPPALNVPGPGSYSPTPAKSAAGYSLGRSARPDPSAQFRSVPGPGAYDPSRPKSAGFSFPKNPRSKEIEDPNPGPGSYDSQLLNKSQLISLRGKPKSPSASRTPVSTI
jgi:hypothetical protein